jgi:hypothetical protein
MNNDLPVAWRARAEKTRGIKYLASPIMLLKTNGGKKPVYGLATMCMKTHGLYCLNHYSDEKNNLSLNRTMKNAAGTSGRGTLSASNRLALLYGALPA